MKHLFAIVICWTLLVSKPATAIDGDTFEAMLEVWYRTFLLTRVRVLDIDTPETRTPTRERAQAAKEFTQDWLNRGPFNLYACTTDSFGRVLGKAYRGDSVLADELKKAGHVK